MNKYTCKHCCAGENQSEYCRSIINFNGLTGHMKRVHPKVDLPRGGYFDKKCPVALVRVTFYFQNLNLFVLILT